jgi:hypothetical protein
VSTKTWFEVGREGLAKLVELVLKDQTEMKILRG